MTFKVLENDFSLCKAINILEINFRAEFLFLGKTDNEISIVCDTEFIPKNCTNIDNGWKAFRIQGQLDFSLVGVISKVTSILAENDVKVFVISTYDTDYILVRNENYDTAYNALLEHGYDFC